MSSTLENTRLDRVVFVLDNDLGVGIGETNSPSHQLGAVMHVELVVESAAALRQSLIGSDPSSAAGTDDFFALLVRGCERISDFDAVEFPEVRIMCVEH